jgi:hypothetical protein
MTRAAPMYRCEKEHADGCGWPGIKRRAAVTVGPIGAVEGGEIDLRDRVEHEPREVILGHHSRTSGGNRNDCSRSHAMKFCPIAEVS